MPFLRLLLLAATVPGCAPAFGQGAPELTMRVTVALVQIDAVVTDAAGRHVPGLSKSDFTVFQDGVPREITHLTWIGSARPAAVDPASTGVPRASRPRPGQARRTLALVVDDLNLSFTSMEFVRQALRKFVDEQVQPGDLVAILRTGAGVGALQQFTTEKRLLHASADRIGWNVRAPTAALARIGEDAGSRVLPSPTEGRVHTTDWDRNADSESAQYRELVFATGTLGALNYVIRGLRNMPGRKTVILFSDGFRLFQSPKDVQLRIDRPDIVQRLHQLTDLANRSAVVINAIDARGLVYPGLKNEDDFAGAPGDLQNALDDRRDSFLEHWQGMNYLARETGGKLWKNTNDLTGSAAAAEAELEGYYLLGYNPGQDAFETREGKAKYHQLRVEMKRPGLRVRTRAGFYGIPDERARPLEQGRVAQLAAAVLSPFDSGGIGLRLTALFGNAAHTGSYVRAMLHIDARDLSFQPDGPGWRKAEIDIAAMTFGAGGTAAGSSNRSYTIRLPEADFNSAARRGFIYTLLHPVAPGPYQLRTAVRDVASGRTGSASQFIEIADVAKGRLALSGIVMHAGLDTGPETDGGAAVETPGSAGLRIFRPGAPVFYGFVVYNARFGPASKRSDVVVQTRVFHRGKQIWAGAPFSMAASNPQDPRRMRAEQQLSFGPATPPGEYLLNVTATDRLAGVAASEWTDFELRP